MSLEEAVQAPCLHMNHERRPDSRIHVRLAARNCSLAVDAAVVRCSVWILQPDAVLYPWVLRFEEVCTAFLEEQAAAAASV